MRHLVAMNDFRNRRARDEQIAVKSQELAQERRQQLDQMKGMS